jgi:hypothetical protein
MTNEDDEDIQVSFKCWVQYFSKYYGCSFIILSQSAMLLFIGSNVARDYIVGNWARNEDAFTNYSYYFRWSLIFSLTSSLGIYCRSAVFQLFTWRAAKLLH